MIADRTREHALHCSVNVPCSHRRPSSCFAAIALTLATIMVEIAMEERRKHSEAAKHLPTTEWHLAAGQSYVCFLSQCRPTDDESVFVCIRVCAAHGAVIESLLHSYKVEAGGDARYLKDALDAMLGKPAYLVRGFRPLDLWVTLSLSARC
jgi:hypothetical protein